MRKCFVFIGLAIAQLVIVAPSSWAQSSSRACDRACLESLVDKYLDAVIAHDPKQLPLAKNVKFTENGVRLEVGDAHWKTVTRKGTYRLFVTDPEAGQVAFIGTIREEARGPEGSPSALALRLRVQDQQINEIETLVIRSTLAQNAGGRGTPAPAATPTYTGAAVNLEKLGKPHHLFMEAVPPAQRMSRADLIKTADMYFSGMEKNDGKGVYPFTDDCNRIENGSLSTNVPLRDGETRPDPKTSNSYSSNWGCKEQFESGLIHFVWRIHDRRYVAVDRERGLVFSFAFFDHALGNDRTFKAPDGRTVTGGPVDPWTWQLAELFKVEKGKIRQIEAVLQRAPYGMNSGWSSWEDGLSSAARDVTK